MVFTRIYNYFNDEEYFEANECINFLEEKINLQIYSIKYTYNI